MILLFIVFYICLKVQHVQPRKAVVEHVTKKDIFWDQKQNLQKGRKCLLGIVFKMDTFQNTLEN